MKPRSHEQKWRPLGHRTKDVSYLDPSFIKRVEQLAGLQVEADPLRFLKQDGVGVVAGTQVETHDIRTMIGFDLIRENANNRAWPVESLDPKLQQRLTYGDKLDLGRLDKEGVKYQVWMRVDGISNLRLLKESELPEYLEVMKQRSKDSAIR